MPLHSSIKDINFLIHLYKYLNIFLITPWYDFRKIEMWNTKACKIYACFLVTINILWLVYTIIGTTISKLYQQMLFTQKLIFFGAYGNTMILTIFTIVKTSFWDGDKWKTLITNFQIVDEKLGNKNKKETCIFRNFYWKCVFHHVLLFVIAAYQLYVWSKISDIPLMETLAISGLKDIYYEFLIIVLLSGIVDCFKSRFEDLNRQLRTETKLKNFQNLTELFRILNENVEIFNELFGYQILFIVSHCGLELVSCLNIAFISYVLLSGDLLRHILLSSVCLLFATTWHFLRIVLPIASSIEEAKKFLHLSSTLPEKLQDSREIEDVVRITNCSRNFLREFSAAGFFSVNKSLVFYVLANVGAYFIIAIQLNEAAILKLRATE